MTARDNYQIRNRNLTILTAVVGVGILILTYKVFEPVFVAAAAPPPAQAKVELPPYDTSAWNALPVQDHGRTKPFESACAESVRQITGRNRFEGQDPVALVLTWIMLRGTNAGAGVMDWEKYPFILCDHQELRKPIYADLVEQDKKNAALPKEEQNPNQEKLPPPEWVNGKYVSPKQLRDSTTFKRLIDEAEEIQQREGEKAQQFLSPEQRMAEEVAGRLQAYDSITQNIPSATRQQRHPFHLIALDRVRGGAWFSIPEIDEIKKEEIARAQLSEKEKARRESKWGVVMKDRLARMPQLYIAPECRKELEKFQEQIKASTAGNPQKALHAVDDLADLLAERTAKKAAAFRQRHAGEEKITLKDLAQDEVFTDMTHVEAVRIGDLIPKEEREKRDEAKLSVEGVASELNRIFADRDREQLENLRQRVKDALARHYHPDDQRFRMLHLDYLEARFPDLYLTSQAWQPFPMTEANRVLDSFEAVRKAYTGGDPEQFASASQDFFTTVREVSSSLDDSYPGVSTLDLEMQYNRIQPFKWSWIIMLAAALLFTASLALRSRAGYVAALVVYGGSLLIQVYGFYARVAISGRPPVSNMYETVIWVSFMSAIFALVLELIYRKKVIGLAGALVSTFGLVLADQLPLALDPRLSPLVPVLRSNFWLTVHVLTIVSSYAGGTLAWGLGNIALGLLAFGKPRREVLKTLSQYTYRAMQIAVLLLAAGTFLGGWWAADSWGRFWGWDPKEVWALIALVTYVIPLHMRFIGWVKDFGLAVSAVLCYAAIMMCWYGVNFVLGAGLHSYGFGGGGPWWVFWAGLINIEYVLVCSLLYSRKMQLQAVAPAAAPVSEEKELAKV
jgi:ABC-type transport system involved in cytochrome c biogenesis permease subunit